MSKISNTIFILIIFTIILLISNINSYNYLFNKKESRKKISSFYEIYERECIKLEISKKKTIECMRIMKSPINKSKCNKYKSSIPPYKRIPYKEIYGRYNGGFNAVIEPTDQNNIDIIVGIPFAPPLIDGRIVARRTYMKVKRIDGYNAFYVLFTGLIPYRIYNYNFSLLKEEAEIYNDLLVFDVVNTYWNITLLLMSMHKWIIEKYPKIKYFIRCNLDAVFIPSRINGLLHKNYDVISQMGRYICWKVNYPQGFFYIFSFKLVKLIYERSFKRKIHRIDDVFYGQIITPDKSINIYDLSISNQSDFFCFFCPILYSKSFISLHSYTYSPAMIELIYYYTLNNVNSNLFNINYN